MLRDPFFWLTELTKTKDEQDLDDPYKPFPKKEYIRLLLELFDAEPVTFLEKSRTMLCSWMVSGWAAHKGFTRPATATVFQSQDEDRSVHDVEYVKELWSNSPDWLKERWPLEKPIDKQPYNALYAANGSSWVAITGDPDKVRSKHPSIYILDEAAIIARGEESFNVGMAAKPLWVIALSSAKPGWFQLFTEDAVPEPWPRREEAA